MKDSPDNGLARFLYSVKRTENKPYAYIGEPENGVTPFGAYGMLLESWDQLSKEAGLGGLDPADSYAQDAVAAYMGQKLFQRYGAWEMVGAAWYAGAQTADQAVQTGQGLLYFKNEQTKTFLETLQKNLESPEAEQASLSAVQRKWLNPQGAPKGWLSPVAGKNEWSPGSWMPNTLTHRGRTHAALDIYAERGTPIVAPVGGKVLSATESDVGGFNVRLQGDDGLTYYFAHMNEAAVVKGGQRIGAGEHIGFVGNSGSASSTKPHLHFSVKKGNTPVSPVSYMKGAKNAGNYFAPSNPQKMEGIGDQAEPVDVMDGLLNSVSDQVAGGQPRIDYRTIGLPDPPSTDQTTKLIGGPQ